MALKKLNLYEFGNSTRTLWVQPTSVFINAGAVCNKLSGVTEDKYAIPRKTSAYTHHLKVNIAFKSVF